MDEYTNDLWTFFMKTKDETKNHVINLILDLQKDKTITVNFIRCDNSGENKDIQQAIIPIPRLKFSLNSQLLIHLNKMVDLSASLQLCMLKSAQR
jgi:hypothetical protein